MNVKFNHHEVFTILELIPTTQNQALEIIDELKIQITIFIQEDFLEHLKNLSFFFIENFQFEIKKIIWRDWTKMWNGKIRQKMSKLAIFQKNLLKPLSIKLNL